MSSSVPGPRQPQHRPQTIANDAEALARAAELAEFFLKDASARDQTRRLPWPELEKFVDSGLWAATIPTEFGGPEISFVTLAQIIAKIGSADGSLAQIPQNHFYALEVLRVGGSPEQKKFFYDRVRTGERTGNALAEIGHKDFLRRTRLIEENGKFFVDGKKFYCTGALYAHWIPTLAVADENGRDVQYLVFVPRAKKGVTVIDDWDGFGQRTTGSGSVVFDRVEVEKLYVVPFQASFERPTTIGPVAQLMHAAIDLGIGEGAYAETLDFVRSRARPWIDSKLERAADDPLTLAELGEVRTRLSAARKMVERAGRFCDAAAQAPDAENVAAASIASAEAKILTTRAGLLAATKFFELSGTSSTLSQDNFDRRWRDLRTHSVHDPVRWKVQAVGKYWLKDERPPRHGAL